MVNVENQIKSLMLNNVEFKINNKIIKKGKIKVFNFKHFFIRFKLENESDYKQFEIPYPFKILKTDNGFIFDYCLSAFIPKTEESYWKLRTFNSDNSSKLHDSYLYITILNP
jgi:hypothetical protein